MAKNKKDRMNEKIKKGFCYYLEGFSWDFCGLRVILLIVFLISLAGFVSAYNFQLFTVINLKGGFV